MLLVTLALPLGAIGTAYGEEPGTGTQPTTEPSTEPSTGVGQEPAEQSLDDSDAAPTEAATELPAEQPAQLPTDEPTGETAEPVAGPTEGPTEEPTEALALQPTAAEPAGLLTTPPDNSGGFEIDGDVAANNGGTDFATVGIHVTDPVGNGDDSTFRGSSGVDHPSTWRNGVGLAPGQDDISDVYAHTGSDGAVWAYFGFRRATTTGTTNYDIEYNQAGNLSGSPARPDRTAGDLLIRVSQQGSDEFGLVGVWEWTVATPGGSLPDGCTPVDGYAPASGWCRTSVPGGAFYGATGEQGRFAEGALNLSLLYGAGDCRGHFGTLNIRSYTGGSDRSSLKDWVGAQSIDVPGTCGALVVHKVDQFGDPVGGAEFTIVPNPVPGAADPRRLVVVDGGAGDPDGTADGVVRIAPARPGDYVVTETDVPAGHLPPADPTEDATVPVDGSDEVTFVNARAFAPLTVVNDARASYDVAHDWRVGKAVDRRRADTPEGTPASFTYTVTLEALPQQRAGHEVHGTVTLTNPNDAPMVATVAAGVTGDVACTFSAPDSSAAAGHQVQVAPGEHGLAYSCAVPGTPDEQGISTATVSWDGDRYPPVPGTDPGNPVTATADYTYTVDRSTDEQVTVTDAFDGGTAQVLGTFTWADVWASTDPAPHTVVVDTYVRDIIGEPGSCDYYTNTATATESDTGQQHSDRRTVEVCVGSDLSIDKNASLVHDRVYGWDVVKSAPTTVFTGDDTAEVTWTVDLTALPWTDSGWVLGGEVLLDNPNDWPVTATVTDTVTVDTRVLPCTLAGADADPDSAGFQVVVPARADDQPYAYTCDGVVQGDYVGTNTATVTWDAAEYFTPGDGDRVAVPVDVTGDPSPAHRTVTLVDSLDGEVVQLPSSTFRWDDVYAQDGHTQRLTYTRTLDATAGRCTPYTNTVTIAETGQSSSASTEVCTPHVAKSVDASYGRTQLWDLDKVVDRDRAEIPQGGAAAFEYTVTATPGEVVDDGSASWTGTVAVRNPSARTPLTVAATDVPDVPGWTCVFDGTGSATATGVVVAPGSTATLDYTCTGAGHPDGRNTVRVDFGDERVSRTVPVSFEPREEVAGATVEVYDDLTDADGPPTLLFVADAADPGTWSHSYRLTQTGEPGTCTPYTNTARISAALTQDPTASTTVEVCVEAAPGLTTSATASVERHHGWTIEKDVSVTRIDLQDDEPPATVDYTVRLTPAERTDTGWRLAGVTTVTNPNDFTDLPVELAQLTDVGEGVVCEYGDGPALTVPPLGSVAAPFTCTLDGTSYTDGTTTASLTRPGGPEATATAPVRFDVVSETGTRITVHDDLADPGGEGRVLGKVEWNPDGTPTEFAYALSLDAEADAECPVRTNTARIVETGQSDDATVTVCRFATAGTTGGDPEPDDPEGPTPVADPSPPATLPDTGAPAGLRQLAVLGLLTTVAGLLLLRQSRRLRRRT